MSRFIVKLAPVKYVEWSNVVDAPVTYILTRAQMREHLLFRYGSEGFPDQRLDQADKIGTSRQMMTLEELLEGNRAGEDEEKLSLEQIIEAYTEEESPDVN